LPKLSKPTSTSLFSVAMWLRDRGRSRQSNAWPLIADLRDLFEVTRIASWLRSSTASASQPNRWIYGPARLLQQTHRDFLDQFEAFVELRVDRIGLVVCCHASPGSDEMPIITPATPDAEIARALSNTGADLVVAGHTHMQFDRLIAKQRMVNAGSVGMPYADQPGA
jgi:diadenosine tetraphosphatase ApaH/serine/threonine PP2A family protein phosphatase